MVDMRKFTNADWNAWAGCEGQSPTIGETMVANGMEIYEAVVIADLTGLHIYCTDNDGCCNWWYRLDTKTQAEAERIADNLSSDCKHDDLIGMGFKFSFM
jgi:hypothetical protein